MHKTKEQWLKDYAHLSDRDRDLLSRAYDVLQHNTIDDPNAPWGNYRVITPWMRDSAGIWNWDSAFHAMAVSRFDTALAQDCIEAFMQFQAEDGMLPDVMFYHSRHLVDDLSKPPVMAWATHLVYTRSGDRAFLERMYPKLVKNEQFWREKRQYEGLFYFSSKNNSAEDNYQRARYESGWDNSPRYDTPIINIWAIDLNCFMVQTYRALADIATVLELDDATVWSEKANALTALINEKLYSPETGIYNDTDRFTGKQNDTLSPACFMPLYIGIAPKAYTEKLHKLAADPQKFFPYMPTVSYDHPAYCTDYWRGNVWLNVAYFAMKGLKDYGYDKTADAMRDALLNLVDSIRDGIYENYDSTHLVGKYWHNFSWSAAFIIEYILNW